MKAFCHGIDTLNEWTGKYTCFLIIPLLVIGLLEVILRYVFNRPTIWAWDVNIQLLGAITVIAAGYTLVKGAHVGIDVVVAHFSPRWRAIIDAVTGVLFVFGIGALLWVTTIAAWDSVLSKEVANSYFAPPVYPLKVLMSIGMLLLFLQGTVKLIRDITKAIRPEAEAKL